MSRLERPRDELGKPYLGFVRPLGQKDVMQQDRIAQRRRSHAFASRIPSSVQELVPPLQSAPKVESNVILSFDVLHGLPWRKQGEASEDG
jgi:hypothetical protein